MLISTATLWILRIPLASYLASTALGVRGIWLAMLIGTFVGALLSAAYYLTGRWRNKVLVKPNSSEDLLTPPPLAKGSRAP